MFVERFQWEFFHQNKFIASHITSLFRKLSSKIPQNDDRVASLNEMVVVGKPQRSRQAKCPLKRFRRWKNPWLSWVQECWMDYGRWPKNWRKTPPKWMVKIMAGKPLFFYGMIFWGKPTIFGNIHIRLEGYHRCYCWSVALAADPRHPVIPPEVFFGVWSVYFLGVPIPFSGRVFGCLGLTCSEDPLFL